MKAKEVLEILQISRSTLFNYVRDGKIKGVRLHNGQYDYDPESVYALLHGNIKRLNVLYCRVSTTKQKQDLVNQEELLKQFCFASGVQINRIFKDIASGISFDKNKRKQFFEMLDLIIQRKVDKVIISYKDRLSRVGFGLFSHLFERFGTEIVVMSEMGNEKLDSQEVFEEIVDLMHCYSMKLYSPRKRKVVKELVVAEE